MEKKRLWQTIRLWTIPGSDKRVEYLKKNCVFNSIGENCSIMDRKVPLYAKMIRLGNNVHIASKVDFITHDIAHAMLNGMQGKVRENGECFREKIGCIEIGDNVFIGAKTTILYDVRVGSNVIIGSGSLVNKDVPDNSVVAGVPARVIGKIDDFIEKRSKEEGYPEKLRPIGQQISKELEDYCWNKFYEKHN